MHTDVPYQPPLPRPGPPLTLEHAPAAAAPAGPNQASIRLAEPEISTELTTSDASPARLPMGVRCHNPTEGLLP